MEIKCRRCKGTDVRRSMRHGFFEHLGKKINLVPWRCKNCNRRFFRFSGSKK